MELRKMKTDIQATLLRQSKIYDHRTKFVIREC